MLTRFLLGLLLCLPLAAGAQNARPDVLLIQLVSGQGFVPDGLGLDQAWQKSSGPCLGSLGDSAIQTALLFGTSPLQQGVVKDLDWRRKPVATTTLAHEFKKNGYQTRFYGAWALGAAAPFDPASRGFDRASFFEAAVQDTLADSWSAPAAGFKFTLEDTDAKNPLFVMVAEGRHLSRTQILQQLKQWSKKKHGPKVVIVFAKGAAKNFQYHQPATWDCYTTGGVENKFEIATDWELNRALRNLLGFETEENPDFTIFHEANWPLKDSPEKHRHRGSLVVGQGHALVDGIRLYPATGLTPDFTRELDIAKHAEKHRQLLKAYGAWWQQAGKALHNPRAFDVGKVDGQSTVLTALDWRASKIIRADGTALLSAPMVYQKDLTGILEGLKTNQKYRQSFPAYSGSWAVNITRPGRYKITASLLPKSTLDPAHKKLMKLNGGSAHIKLGRNEVQLRLTKGASVVSVKTDADAGVTDLECWFTGQLALTRELGAFFVEIERVGDKKFDLKPK